MTHKLSPILQDKLRCFNNRKLNQGEIFLLSKALSDVLPLPEASTDNIIIHNLKHKNFISSVIDELYSFAHIEDSSKVYELINELTLWRFNIAYNPPAPFFQGKQETVIDDISCLLRYIDTSDICPVSDISENANHIYNMFKELALIIKANGSA